MACESTFCRIRFAREQPGAPGASYVDGGYELVIGTEDSDDESIVPDQWFYMLIEPEEGFVEFSVRAENTTKFSQCA